MRPGSILLAQAPSRAEALKEFRNVFPEDEGWAEVPARFFGDMIVGDFLIAYPAPGRVLVWRISAAGPEKYDRVLVTDTAGRFKEGEVSSVPLSAPIHSWEGVFRRSRPSDGSTWWIVGGVATLAVVTTGLYILFRPR